MPNGFKVHRNNLPIMKETATTIGHARALTDWSAKKMPLDTYGEISGVSH